MALIADGPADRADQLLILTERLVELIEAETGRIARREPPATGAEADERARLANAYRLELARIKQEPSLLAGAPPALVAQLKTATARLHEILGAHELELGAVKLIAEGLVQAMAEEVVRQRNAGAGYNAQGDHSSGRATPVTLDRSA